MALGKLIVNNDGTAPTPSDIDNSINLDPLKSTKFKDNLGIMFGNCDALTMTKANRLKMLTQEDHIICLNETNYKESDATLFTQAGLGHMAVVKSLDNVSFKRGKRVVPTRRGIQCTKQKSYGTAIVSRLTNGVKLYKYSGSEELVYATLDLNNTKGLIITGYRSPSSKDLEDIRAFYSALESIITDQTSLHEFDFIIFVGDDNSYKDKTRYYAWNAAAEMERVADTFQMVDMIPNMLTRKHRQPDSCFAYFNPESIEICASLMNQMDSDHQFIHIQIKKSEIIAEQPKFKKMIYRKQVVSDEELTKTFEESIEKWRTKWAHIPTQNITMKKQNKATATLMESINSVRHKCFRKRYRNVHKAATKEDDDINLNILRLRARISKLAW